jgi:DNA-binding CsgD family transcriptional regulator
MKPLTPKHLKVLKLVALGLNRKEIAEKLRLTVKGAEYISLSARRRVGIENPVKLSLWAVANKLIQNPFLLLCLFVSGVQSAPINAKLSNLLMQPAVVEATAPTVTLTIFATPNLQGPVWQVLTNVAVPVSWISQYTNQPSYSQHLACDPITDPIIAGVKIHWGTTNAIDFGLTTNFFVTGLPSTPVTFYTTTYASNGAESVPSNAVTAPPNTNYPPLTVFFKDTAPVTTKLAISK